MKAKLLTAVCVVVVSLGSVASSSAAESGGALAVVADTLIVRPACLVATVIGSAFFVVSLPVAVMSQSVDETAQALVAKPARATFSRPLGDMEGLLED